MHSSLLTTLAALSYVHASKFVNIPLQKQTDLSSSLLDKRQAEANGSLILNPTSSAYLANISIGTPAQHLQLILDTGSPLTWVNAQNVSTFTPGQTPTASEEAQGATICQTNTCLNPGSTTSLTVLSNSTIFDIQYVDGTESIGRIVQDSMTFQTLSDMTFEFGLVEYFYSPQGVSASLAGILGLSPPNPVLNFKNLTAALTATTSTAYFTPQTILQQLQNAGAIENTAFSLYLSDGVSGQLTIGGVDNARYSGPLTVLPIITDPTTVGQSFQVTVNAVGSGGTTSNEVTVNSALVLDSGTTSMYLPVAAVEQLATNLGGYFVPYDSTSGLLAIPCTVSTTIDFYFTNSAVIRVPTSEILEGRLTAAQAARNGITGATGDVCVLSLFGTTDSASYLLGDSFLRSAYVVYDLAQGVIALGQARYDQSSNISAITSGAYGIPGGVYNSSSPGASNVAVVPSATNTLTVASGMGVRTSVAVGGTATLTRTTGTATSTSTTTTSTARSGADLVAFSEASTYLAALIGALVGTSLLMV